MKLQTQLHATQGLDENLRKDLIYTNTRTMGDIGDKIMYNNVNYAGTYKKLTGDQNTNTILTAITLRNVHLNTDPLGNQA